MQAVRFPIVESSSYLVTYLDNTTGDKSYFIDDEIFIDDETKIDYLNENQGKSIENHKPLKMFDYEVVITKSFSFIARRTLQKQLEVSTGNGILFEVPFFLASTEV